MRLGDASLLWCHRLRLQDCHRHLRNQVLFQQATNGPFQLAHEILPGWSHPGGLTWNISYNDLQWISYFNSNEYHISYYSLKWTSYFNSNESFSDNCLVFKTLFDYRVNEIGTAVMWREMTSRNLGCVYAMHIHLIGTHTSWIYESLFMNGLMTIPRDRQITSNSPSFDRSTRKYLNRTGLRKKMNDIWHAGLVYV